VLKPEEPAPKEPPNPRAGGSAEPAPPEVILAQQADKPKEVNRDEERKKKEPDLPDVSFVVPEETRGELKAIIKREANNLRSRNSSERRKAAEVLGELGPDGKPVRGLLVRAMLNRYEPDTTVQFAAGDALKKIDPRAQFLAVSLIKDEQPSERIKLLRSVQRLGDEGEPLSILVAECATRSAASNRNRSSNDVAILSQALTTLSHIASKDRGACRFIAWDLGNPSETVRRSAIEGLARMKHGGLEISKLMDLLVRDVPENQVAVIQTLVALADKTTEQAIARVVARQRYHRDERVRRAVEEGLNKLRNRRDP
jgi:hypothetical protein